MTIPAEAARPELGEKLKAEWPGILQWMIEGCPDWQEFGLAPPAAVTDATAAYLEAEDASPPGSRIAATRDAGAWETRDALFASWKLWAEGAGEYCGAAKRFYQALEARGFHHEKRHGGKRGFAGLKIGGK